MAVKVGLVTLIEHMAVNVGLVILVEHMAVKVGFSYSSRAHGGKS